MTLVWGGELAKIIRGSGCNMLMGGYGRIWWEIEVQARMVSTVAEIKTDNGMNLQETVKAH